MPLVLGDGGVDDDADVSWNGRGGCYQRLPRAAPEESGDEGTATAPTAATGAARIRISQLVNGAPAPAQPAGSLKRQPAPDSAATLSQDNRWSHFQTPPAMRVLHECGKKNYIYGCAMSSGGTFVVSASQDHTVRVDDLSGSTVRQALEGHKKPVRCCVMSSNDRYVVSASEDKTVRIWDLKEQHPPLVLCGHATEVWACAVSADGKCIVSGSRDSTVCVWDMAPSLSPIPSSTDWSWGDLRAQPTVRVLQGHTDHVRGCAVSVDSRYVVSASDDGKVCVWDLEERDPSDSAVVRPDPVSGTAVCADASQPQILFGHKAAVFSCALSTDSRYVISASADKTVRIWDLRAENPSASAQVLQGHQKEVYSCVLSGQNRYVVSASGDCTVRVWDLDTEDPSASALVLKGHEDAVRCCALSADGHYVASASDYVASASDINSAVHVWNLCAEDPSTKMRVLKGHAATVLCHVVSGDGKHGVSASRDATVRVWDLHNQTSDTPLVLRGHTSDVNDCAVTVDGRYVVSASDDGTVRVWDLDNPNNVRVLKGHEYEVVSCSVSASRRVVSTSADTTVRVWEGGRVTEGGWDLKNLGIKVVLRGHEATVRCCAVSVDGNCVVSASDDGTVCVWDLRREALASGSVSAHVFRGHHQKAIWGCAVSSDGRYVVTASEDATLRVLDLENDDPSATAKTLKGHMDGVYSCVLSPDDYYVVSSSADGTIRAWNIQTGRELVPFRRAFGMVPTDICAVTDSSQQLGQFPVMVRFRATCRQGSDKDLNVQTLDYSVLYSSPRGDTLWLQRNFVPRTEWQHQIEAVVRDGYGSALYQRDSRNVTLLHRLCNEPDAHDDLGALFTTFKAERQAAAIAVNCCTIEEKRHRVVGEYMIGLVSRAGEAPLEKTSISSTDDEHQQPISILRLAIEKNLEETLKLLLNDYLLYCKVPTHPPAPTHLLSETDLVHMFKKFPEMASAFLHDLSSKPTCLVDKTRKCDFSRYSDTFLVLEATDPDNPVLWQRKIEAEFKKLTGNDLQKGADGWGVSTTSKLIPFKGLGSAICHNTAERDVESRSRHRIDSKLDFSELLEVAVQYVQGNNERVKVFQSVALQAIVAHKWRTIGKSMYYTRFAFYALFVFNFSTLCLYYISWENHHDERTGLAHILLGCAVTQTILLIKEEGTQMAREKCRYLQDPLNWLDVLTCALVGLSLYQMSSFRTEHARTLYSIAGFLCWVKFLYFLRGLETNAFTINVIIRNLGQLKDFLVVLVVVLCGFALSLFMLFTHDDEALRDTAKAPTDRATKLWHEAFRNVGDAAVTVFGMMSGDFSSHDFQEGSLPLVSLALFVAFMLLVPIIMVNVLIASMADAFNFVSERRKAFVTFARAMIILELEHLQRRGEIKHAESYCCSRNFYICSRVLLSCNIFERSAPFLHVLEPVNMPDSEQDALKVKKPDFLLSMAASIGRIEGTAVPTRTFTKYADGIHTTIQTTAGSQQGFNEEIRREQARIDMTLTEVQDQLSLLLQHFQIHVSSSHGATLSIDSRRLMSRNTADPFQNWQLVAHGYYSTVYVVEDLSPPIQVCTKLSAVDGHNQSSIRKFRCAAVYVAKHNDESSELFRNEAKYLELSNLDHHKNITVCLGMCEGPCPDKTRSNNLMLCFERCDFDLTIPIYNKQRGQFSSSGLKPVLHKGLSWDEGSRLSWARRLDFAQQMADGLAYIHANKYVHWSLSPRSILMKRREDGGWVVKVNRFGLRHSYTDQAAKPLCHRMAGLSTPEYTAPEVWCGHPVPASDVFSVGVMLWELYTQRRVYTGFSSFDLHTMNLDRIPQWMATQNARPEIPKECPPAWALLIKSCWAAEPSRRPGFDGIKVALSAMAPIVADWADDAKSAAALTVQQWLELLGLGAKAELFIGASGLQEGKKYLEGIKTIEDSEFRELLEDIEDLDEGVDEMVGEEEDKLTENEAAKLKEALRALANPDQQASAVGPWQELCDMLPIQPTASTSLYGEHGDSAQGMEELQAKLQAKHVELQSKDDQLRKMEAELKALRAEQASR